MKKAKVRISLMFLVCLSVTGLFHYSLAQSVNEVACEQNYFIEDEVSPQLYEYASQILIFSRDVSNSGITNIRFNGEVNSDLANNIAIPSEVPTLTAVQPAASLSPDGTRLLSKFLDTEGVPIVIISSLQEFDEIQIRGESEVIWNVVPYWLNDNEVVVSEIYYDDFSIIVYTLIDVNTGSDYIITVEIPSELPTSLDFPVLSPDKEQVMYSTFSRGTDESVILNINTSDYVVTPQLSRARDILWSPSSDYVAFAVDPDEHNAPQQLKVLTVDGDEVASLSLNLYDMPPLQDVYFQWSPDSQRVVYYDGVVEYEGLTLAHSNVFDVTMNEITAICLPGEVYWSPDSQYLFFYVRTALPDSPPVNRSTHIFDLETATQLDTTEVNIEIIASIIGWADLTEG